MSRLSPVIQEANRIAFQRNAATKLKKMQIKQWLKENPEIGTTITGRFYIMIKCPPAGKYKMKYVYPPKKMSLEERIEKAIAENSCPFTTDADIRYFETEEHLKNINK
jgi:hypothetical protein